MRTVCTTTQYSRPYMHISVIFLPGIFPSIPSTYLHEKSISRGTTSRHQIFLYSTQIIHLKQDQNPQLPVPPPKMLAYMRWIIWVEYKKSWWRLVVPLLIPFSCKYVLGILWEYPGKENNRYMHIWPAILSGSTDCPHIWLWHMGDHYIQAPGLWGCVLGDIDI